MGGLWVAVDIGGHGIAEQAHLKTQNPGRTEQPFLAKDVKIAQKQHSVSARILSSAVALHGTGSRGWLPVAPRDPAG